jgi:hypothetical protein
MKKPDASLDRIRVPAVLAHYPVHRLTTRQSSGAIEVREVTEAGELTVRWQVRNQGGPLAYRIDTLIVNRRIDEASRPIPRIIRLGTMREIARELGVNDDDTERIREALLQNAGALIVAKIRFRCSDGRERTSELGGTRYSVVLTGDKWPDGRTADAVYLILNDPFVEILNNAQRRPLDYDYLRSLGPAAQRLYELLSVPMYMALKNGKGPARYNYSDFCMLAPQSRYETLWEARKQMKRIHTEHEQAGYISQVEFETTRDREGRPDWTMLYTPGPRAKAEFRAFTRRLDAPAQFPLPLDPPAPEPAPPAPAPVVAPLVAELVSRGVSATVAADLVGNVPEERIRKQLAALDWLLKHPRQKTIDDPAAWLVEAIRDDYAPPAGLAAAAKRAERRASEEAQAAAARAQRSRAQTEEAQVAAYWAGLSAAERAALEAEALEQATPEVRAQCALGRPRFVQALRQKACEEQIRRRLGLPLPS